MKRLLLICMVALLLSACNETWVYNEPVVENNHSDYHLFLQRVTCSPEETRLDLTVFCPPNGKFSINGDCYLQGNEKRYNLTGTEGFVVPNRQMKTDSTGVCCITLLFEPIARNEKSIDFIESDDWKLLGIRLEKPKTAKIECHIEGIVYDRPQSKAILLNTPDKVFHRFVQGSTLIPIHDGRFSYTLRTNERQVYGLCLLDEFQNGTMRSKEFFAETGNVTVTIYGEDSVRIEGGELTTELQALDHIPHSLLSPLYEKRDALDDADKWYTPGTYAAMEAARKKEDWARVRDLGNDDNSLSKEARQVNEEIKLARAGINRLLFDQIRHNPTLPSYYNLLQNIEHSVVYKKTTAPDSVADIFHTIYKPLYPSHPFTCNIEKMLIAQRTLTEGEFINITLPDSSGTEHQLSQLLAGCKIGIIDFWALYCEPCRRFSKSMIPVYEKYKDLGLTIVGISRDSRDQMIKGITKDGYPWINLLDEYNRNAVFERYGIGNAAGGTFFVDSDGRIIARDLSTEEATGLIEQYCK